MSKRKKKIWDEKVNFKIKSKQKKHHNFMVGQTFEPENRGKIDLEHDPDINYEKLKKYGQQ